MYETIRYYRRIETPSFVATPATQSFDAATIAWVNAVVANGGTVSAGRKTIVDNLIVGLKADGIFTQLDRLWLLAAENQPSALTDIIADALATAVNSPTFTVDTGYTGENTSTPTKYINSAYNPTASGVGYTLNSAHMSAWCTTDVAGAASTGCAVGSASAGGESDIFDTFSDGNCYFRINSGASANSGAPPARTGHFITNRTGALASQAYRNGTNFATPNTAATGIPNVNTYILALNNNSVLFGGDPNTIAQVSMGGGLSPTDATNFYNRLRTYMTAVGVP